MTVTEILLLAVLSAFWPTLIIVVLVAIRTPHPIRILSAFLAGGLLTCVAVGGTAVHVLRGTAVVSGSKQTTDPIVNLTCGALALLGSYALHRYQASHRLKKSNTTNEKRDPPAWAERFVARGAILAFGAGIVLNIAPGILPLVAIKDIAELQAGAAASLAILTGFYVIMFSFVEIPLLGSVFAPASTVTAVGRFNDWLSANAWRVMTAALTAAGLYLLVRGIVGELTS